MPPLSNLPRILAGGLVAITLLMLMRSFPPPSPAASAPALHAPLRSHASSASSSSPYYDLSYALPAWFPYAYGYRLVMETIPGTCDLLWNGGTSAPCAAFGNSRAYEPDPHVREAIASVLHHCSNVDCISLDLGANIGSLTAYMAATGSRVLAMEPQLDLAQAIEKPRLPCPEVAGGHAFSVDGVAWNYTGVAFNATGFYTDGTPFSFLRRERPHPIMAADGVTIVALTTGVNYRDASTAHGDATFTFLQPVATS